MGEPGTAVLIVRLGRNGVVRHLRVARSTRDQALMTAAEGTLKSASPYPPFPPGVKAHRIKLRVIFLYD